MSAAARSSLSVCRDLFFALWQFSRIYPCRAPLQQKRHSTRFGFPFPEAAVTNAADLMSNRCVVFGSSPPGCASFFPPTSDHGKLSSSCGFYIGAAKMMVAPQQLLIWSAWQCYRTSLNCFSRALCSPHLCPLRAGSYLCVCCRCEA